MNLQDVCACRTVRFRDVQAGVMSSIRSSTTRTMFYHWERMDLACRICTENGAKPVFFMKACLATRLGICNKKLESLEKSGGVSDV